MDDLPPAGPVPPAPTTAEVRAWARQHRLAVADRGRLHPDVWAAYHEQVAEEIETLSGEQGGAMTGVYRSEELDTLRDEWD